MNKLSRRKFIAAAFMSGLLMSLGIRPKMEEIEKPSEEITYLVSFWVNDMHFEGTIGPGVPPLWWRWTGTSHPNYRQTAVAEKLPMLQSQRPAQTAHGLSAEHLS